MKKSQMKSSFARKENNLISTIAKDLNVRSTTSQRKNFANYDYSRPLVKRVVDFLKETCKFSQDKPKTSYIKPINGVTSLSRTSNNFFTSRNRKRQFKSTTLLNSDTLNTLSSDSSSENATAKKKNSKDFTEFEKARARLKFQERESRRMLRDLSYDRIRTPWSVEFNHKLTEVKRYALFQKYSKYKPFKRAAIRTRKIFQKSKQEED